MTIKGKNKGLSRLRPGVGKIVNLQTELDAVWEYLSKIEEDCIAKAEMIDELAGALKAEQGDDDKENYCEEKCEEALVQKMEGPDSVENESQNVVMKELADLENTQESMAEDQKLKQEWNQEVKQELESIGGFKELAVVKGLEDIQESVAEEHKLKEEIVSSGDSKEFAAVNDLEDTQESLAEDQKFKQELESSGDKEELAAVKDLEDTLDQKSEEANAAKLWMTPRSPWRRSRSSSRS